MTIKLTAAGKVITKGGLPTCTCCGGCVETDCYGDWGPGYDSHPNSVTLTVDPIAGLNTTPYVVTLARVSKCEWTSPGPCAFGPDDIDFVRFDGCEFGWSASASVCLVAGYINWVGERGPIPVVPGNGNEFTDGPLGLYVGGLGNATVT
jgi:hypothetical protein